MILINSVELCNFLSHSKSLVNFNSTNGMVLISGENVDGRFDSNGAGKSTILEAIIWSLTGNTLRGVGANDIVNRFVGKDTKVTLDLTVDNDSYQITRYRKDTVHGDSLVFTKNGENLSKRLNKDTQNDINSLLNIPYTILTSSILLGEGLSSRFTQLSDPDKKSLIESTLTLDYDIKQLRDLSNKILKDRKTEMSTLLGSIESTKSMLENLRTSDVVTQEDIDKIIVERDKAVSKVTELTEVINTLSVKSNTLSKGRAQVADLLRELSKLQQQIDQLNKSIEDTSNAEEVICELCHQKVTSKDSIDYMLSKYNSNLKSITEQSDSIKSELGNLPSLDIIDKSITDVNKKYQEVYSELNETRSVESSLIGKVKELETTKSNSDKLNDKLVEFNNSLKSDEKRVNDLSYDVTSYEYIYNMLGPTGLINFILQESIDYINDRLQIYSNMLIDKNYKLDFTRGKLTLVDDSGASYQSLSNGEKRRLDICIQFSLHDYVYNYCDVKVNILFIDEILDTLDSTGVDNIFDVLRLKMEYCSLDGIYVITHNGDLKDKFDRYITVCKDINGMSTIK